MDFSLPAELIEFQELIRQVATDQIAPRAAEVDETGEYPQDLFEVFRDVGLLGLCIPAEHGGSGAGLLGLALALEELSKVSVAAAVILELPRTSAGALIMAAGASELRERYLPGIAEGSQRAAVALAEPGGGDVLGIATVAQRESGGWVLSGTKSSVLGAAQADWFVVFVKTDEPASRARGSVSAFVVDARLEGVSLGRPASRDGVRGIDAVELVLDGVHVAPECVIGAVGGGLRLATLVANVGGPLAAARAMGLAQGALMLAVETVGAVAPDGLRREIALLAADVEAVRLLALRAAWMIDVGQSDRQWSAHLALANCHAAEVATRAADLAAAVGAVGPVERWVRDARQLLQDQGERLGAIADGVLAHELWWGGLELD
jgi:alkylation response protein AidB-like acyl-CoA dehydrogenase